MLRRLLPSRSANAWSNRTSMQVGDWTCAGCAFVAPRRSTHCPECATQRSPDAAVIGQWRCGACESSNHSSRHRCWRCDMTKVASSAPARRRHVVADAFKQADDGDAGDAEAVSSGSVGVRPHGELLPSGVRLIRRWRCTFCATTNELSRPTCRRCDHFRPPLAL